MSAPTPTGHVYSTGTGAKRQWRAVIDGELVRNPNGSEKALTESAARKALQAAGVPPAGTPARSPRLDGLTHEQAAARYGTPPSAPRVLRMHQDAHGTHYLHTAGSTAHVSGHGVHLRDGTGRTIYQGTLAALTDGGARGSHDAVVLAVWGQVLRDGGH